MSNTTKRILAAVILLLILLFVFYLGQSVFIFFIILIGLFLIDETVINIFKFRRHSVTYFFNVFFYIDPPYYKKGALLYLNSFTHDKHLELSEFLNGNDKAKWILSYDDVPEIRSMYIPYGRRFESYNLRYSVHRNTRLGSELVIYSDDILI